jgi:peptidoglycan hydrolase CwlO-like protein
MSFWEQVKKDLRKGIKEGITFVKEGAIVIKEKAEELTLEGKKRYKLFELKTEVQKQIANLGGRVYDLSSKAKNPMLDSKVKAILSRIKKIENRITKLEKSLEKLSKKAGTKRITKSRVNKSLAKIAGRHG